MLGFINIEADPDSDKNNFRLEADPDPSGRICICFCSKVCWVYRHKNGFRIAHFLSRSDPDYSFVLNRIRNKIKPAAGGGSSLF